METCLYCERKIIAKGLCSLHYDRWRLRRPMEAPLNYGGQFKKGHNLIDLTGQVFTRLTVLECLGTERESGLWRCRCECGNEVITSTKLLRRAEKKSCGCYHSDSAREHIVNLNKTHGMSGSTEYNTWVSMKDRCNNPKSESYHLYGGRGIKISESWDSSFETFYADMGPKPSIKHSIDRIDPWKGYNKENCRWATSSEQINNRRHELALKEIDRLRALVAELGGEC